VIRGQEALLRRDIPWVSWDEPVQVHVLGRPAGRWVCRFCIALHGLAAAQIDTTPFAFDTRNEANAHIKQAHQ